MANRFDATGAAAHAFLDEVLEFDTDDKFLAIWAIQKALAFTGWSCPNCGSWEMSQPDGPCPECGSTRSPVLVMLMEALNSVEASSCRDIPDWSSPLADVVREQMPESLDGLIAFPETPLTCWDEREGIDGSMHEATGTWTYLLDPSGSRLHMVSTVDGDFSIESENFGGDENAQIDLFVSQFEASRDAPD